MQEKDRLKIKKTAEIMVSRDWESTVSWGGGGGDSWYFEQSPLESTVTPKLKTREWTGLEFGKSQRAVENREKWRKLVPKLSAVSYTHLTLPTKLSV